MDAKRAKKLVARCNVVARLPRPASEGDSRDPSVLFRMALNLYLKGEYFRAVGFLRRANRIRPHPVMLFYIGSCYRKLKNFKQAARLYRLFLFRLKNRSGRYSRFVAEAEAFLKSYRP